MAAQCVVDGAAQCPATGLVLGGHRKSALLVHERGAVVWLP